jgi:restriction system protein
MTEQIWGLHNDKLNHQLLDDGFDSVSGDEIGELSKLPGGRACMKSALADKHPDAKTNSIAGQAGGLYRFAHDVAVDDIIVAPYIPDSTINIGIVESP